MKRLREIVEESDSRAGRAFDLAIQALIVLSIASFALETLPDLSAETQRFLDRVELVVVSVFTLEYILRVVVAEKKRRFVFSFFGLVDLISILPFYLATSVDLRALRACRFLRLFAILKLGRYTRAASQFRRAFMIVREELALFFSVALLLLFFSAVGVYHFEREAQPERFASLFDGLWWAVVTLTTVGYGDLYPVTAGGRVFTFIVLMIGLGLVAVPSGLLATALTEARREERSSPASEESQ